MRALVTNRIRFLILLAGLLLASVSSAQVAKLPRLADVPPQLNAQDRATLNQQKATLESELKSFQNAGDAFTAKNADDQTEAEYEALLSRRKTYIEHATAFNKRVASAKVVPFGDPMIVDAQRVPSGLSKALDDAIADLYGNAPPGVSERMRRGFQAVQARDWTLAKAWFQDALNRDATNIGIARLVALCDYDQSVSKLALPEPAILNLSPPKAMSRPERDAYLKILSKERDQILAQDLVRAINGFYLEYAPKHPELKLLVETLAAPARKADAAVEAFIKRLKEMVNPPDKKKGRTIVNAVRG